MSPTMFISLWGTNSGWLGAETEPAVLDVCDCVSTAFLSLSFSRLGVEALDTI